MKARPASSGTTRSARVGERALRQRRQQRDSAPQRWTERYHLCTARTFLLSWREWTRGPKRVCVTLTYYVDIRNVRRRRNRGGWLRCLGTFILNAIWTVQHSQDSCWRGMSVSRNNTFVNSQRNFIRAIIQKGFKFFMIQDRRFGERSVLTPF